MSASMFDHVDIAVSDLDASRAFYTLALGEQTAGHEWAEWGDFGIIEVDADHPAHRAPAHRLRRREPRGRRRVVAAHGRRRLPKRRRAGPAPAVQRHLLRRLRPRSRRQLGRGRPPPPKPHGRDGPPLAADDRPRRDAALLRGGRARGRHPARARRAGASRLHRRRRLVHVRPRRGADEARAPRLRRRGPRAGRGVPPAGDSPPGSRTTARRASARSTTPATTARSCSTPSETTSRPSSTTAASANLVREFPGLGRRGGAREPPLR